MLQSHDPTAKLSVLLVLLHGSNVRGFRLLHFQITFIIQPDATAAAAAAAAAAVAGCEAVSIATHSLETS